VRRADYFVVKPTWENLPIQEIDEFSSAMTSVFDPTIIAEAVQVKLEYLVKPYFPLFPKINC
jgi:hypothetical protein